MITKSYEIMTQYGITSNYQIVSKIYYNYQTKVLEYEFNLYINQDLYNQDYPPLIVSKYFIEKINTVEEIETAINTDLDSKFNS